MTELLVDDYCMLLDILLPSPCLLCSKIGKPICFSCITKLQLKGTHVKLEPLTGLAFSEYSDETALIVNSIKEKGFTAALDSLAKAMLESWPEQWAVANLVPIPSSPENQRKRGFSHTLLWARALAKNSRGLKVTPILVSTKSRKDQAQLNPDQRLTNMAQAFTVKGQIKAGPILLLDDVLTTGATLGAAETALAGAGLKGASFCVFTRVKPRNTL